MKTFTQALMVALIVVAAAIGGAYYFTEREYAAKPELQQTRAAVSSLQEELSGVKQLLSRQQAEHRSAREQIDQQLAALDGTVRELKDIFLEWKGLKKSELDENREALEGLRDSTEAALQALQEQANATVTSLREQIAGLQEVYISRETLDAVLDKAFKTAASAYQPVDIDLGELPSGKPRTVNRPLPEAIPDSAREILVYAYVATNYVKGGNHSFRIGVRVDEDREAAFYLYAIADTQRMWSYNSENAWLPMPADRTLRLRANGDSALYGEWQSGVKIVAYR